MPVTIRPLEGENLVTSPEVEWGVVEQAISLAPPAGDGAGDRNRTCTGARTKSEPTIGCHQHLLQELDSNQRWPFGARLTAAWILRSPIPECSRSDPEGPLLGRTTGDLPRARMRAVTPLRVVKDRRRKCAAKFRELDSNQHHAVQSRRSCR